MIALNQANNFSMKKILLVSLLQFVLIFILHAQALRSPDGNLLMNFSLLADGTPTYTLVYKNKPVIRQSKLGFVLKNDKKSLLDDFTILDSTSSTFDETWKPVWGEVKDVRN